MIGWRQWARRVGSAGVVGGVSGLALIGCLDRPIERVEPRTTSTVIERLTQSGVDKIDLLFAIDNSISMGDKQQILALAVPDLVDRLINPICVDDTGAPVGTQPASPLEECAEGEREFPPITDINVGVISSSLGALTGNQCDGLPTPVGHPNDGGRLLSRASGGGTVATYQSKGFLAWDPENARAGTTDKTTLVNDLRDMVVGVDQLGCGYEMQLESIYRFLADPEPYGSLTRDGGGNVVKEGVDQTLLDQRRDFLRPNSLLAIVMLSDENDCSVAVDGQGYLVLSQAPFYRATSACATDPNSECCTSCGLNGGQVDGCGDPGCGTPSYSAVEDHGNLRCWNQKRRYGVNFLYPTQRYVNAFTQTQINPDARDLGLDGGEGVDNPIFSDLQDTGGTVRDPGLVFLAGIVGVPWQAIARRDEGGNPSLTLGFKTFNELQQDDAFTQLVGNPDESIDPTDPFMIESVAQRSGSSALTGASLPGANPINGNDRTIAGNNNLQYACIFDLAEPVPGSQDCDECLDASCDDPLCNLTTQIKAKAYPGLRELAVLRGMADQGIFASICPAQQDNPAGADFGYRPAVAAIIDRLKLALGGQCLPRQLTPDLEGNVPCFVLEASTNSACDCNAVPGRRDVPEDKQPAVDAAKQDAFANDSWNCFCEVVQLTGDDRAACQNDEDVAAGIDGWCYVDATTVPQTGNPALVSNCPPNEQRIVRFVNGGETQTGATVYITCSGE